MLKNTVSEKSGYIFIMVVILLVILCAFYFINMLNKTNKLKKENQAESYTEEKNTLIQHAIDNELNTALWLSSSILIKNFMKSPEDKTISSLAFDEFATYKARFSSNTIFWVNSKDLRFYFDMKYSYTLNPLSEDSHWYNVTTNEKEAYNLNIDYNTELNQTYLWINAPVFDNDVAVGVIGIAILYNNFLNILYNDINKDFNFYIFNRNLEIVASKNTRESLNKVNIVSMFPDLEKTLSQINVNSNFNKSIVYFKNNNKDYVGAILKDKNIGWYFLCFVENKVNYFSYEYIFVFLVSIITVGIIFVVFNSINREKELLDYSNKKKSIGIKKYAKIVYLFTFLFYIYFIIQSFILKASPMFSFFCVIAMIVSTFVAFSKKSSIGLQKYISTLLLLVFATIYGTIRGDIGIIQGIFIAIVCVNSMYLDIKLNIFQALYIFIMYIFFIMFFPDIVFTDSLSPRDIIIKIVTITIGQIILIVLILQIKKLNINNEAKTLNSKMLLKIVEDKRSEAIQANKSKSDFLANMSHEIRTPMNAISGMTDFIIRDSEDEMIKEHALKIKSASSTLLSIINDILDFSKIEAGRLEIINAEFQLSSVINDVVNIISTRIGDKPIDFVIDIDASIPAYLIGDEIRIRQIFVNLLSNAVKFTKEGYVGFKLEVKHTSEEEIVLFSEVFDTGIGIKPSDFDKLFTSFTQVDTKRNRTIEGSGLGLSICKKLTELMGGDIYFKSTYGEGSSFFFTLKVKVSRDEKILNIEDIEHKKIAVLESKVLFEQSAQKTLNSFNVKNFVTSNKNDFIKEITKYGKEYTNLIIYYSIYNELKEYIEMYAPNASVALILDMNEHYKYIKNVRVLYRPCYSLNYAAILNNKNFAFIIGGEHLLDTNFKAPRARVLVVDDNTVNLEIVKGMMQPYQINVTTALSADECFNLLKYNFYDIVFMDHMMPVIDGMEAVKIIRKYNDAHYKNMPIIALTANAISGAREMYIANGFTDFLSKPIEIKNLNKILYTYIPEEYIEDDTKYSNVSINKNISDVSINKNVSENILKTIYIDGLKKIPLIKKLFEENNIKNYTIEVHALKSIAASVGNTKLASMAKDHEDAGKNNNIDYIKENFNSLIESYEMFVESLSYFKNKKEEIEKTKRSEEDIKLLFEKVRKCAREFNIDGINDAVSVLKKSTLEEKETLLLDKIIEASDLLDYESIEKAFS